MPTPLLTLNGMSDESSRVLDTNDLPCGLSDKSGNRNLENDYISDYQPLVTLSAKLKQLMPARSSCYGNIFQGQDPPTTLSPVMRLPSEPKIVQVNLQLTPTAPSLPSPSLSGNRSKYREASASECCYGSEGNCSSDYRSPAQTASSSVLQVIGNDPGPSGGSEHVQNLSFRKLRR